MSQMVTAPKCQTVDGNIVIQNTKQAMQQQNSNQTKTKQIYHERQSLQLCALHSLNNLFQDSKAFTKQMLDEICVELDRTNPSLLNPHKSSLGLGCYDVNVIISALSKKGYNVIWFDRRKDPSCLVLNNIFGFILNFSNSSFFPLNYLPLMSNKHWTCARKIDDTYYHIDSKHVAPEVIGDDEALVQMLKSEKAKIEILIVIKADVSVESVIT